MFIVVLLIATVSSEWVEISQNYRKQDPPRHQQTFGLEHPAENFTYTNQSLGQWRRGSIDKIANIGNVRRIADVSVTTASLKPNSDIKNRKTASVPQETVQNNKSKIQKLNLRNYQSATVIKSSNPGSDHNIKNRSKLNSISTDETVSNEYFQSSIEKINGETSDREGLPSYPDMTKVLSNADEIKILKDQYKNDAIVKDTHVSEKNKMERVWDTIKLVADTISKHSRRGFKNKVRYLEGLKDNIIISIEDLVERLWPDDGGADRFRRSAEGRGHVEVPSSEGALMSISFLTFAVFLIKLVLQVIHAYKQKSMMVTPAVVAAMGRTSAIFTNSFH